MKKVILMMALVISALIQTPSWAYETVSGYIRSNGTVVAPYIRSSRDGNLWNNLSSSIEQSKHDQYAYVRVNGYLRSNGTYVAPYIRSNPDGNPWNNLSSLKDDKVISSPFVPMTVASNLEIV